MNVNFEHLELLPQIKELLVSSTSPYMTIKETANYLKESESTFRKRFRDGEFINGTHYLVKKGGKVLFIKTAIDKWLLSFASKEMIKEKNLTEDVVGGAINDFVNRFNDEIEK